MRFRVIYVSLLLFACNNEPKDTIVATRKTDTVVPASFDTVATDTADRFDKDTTEDKIVVKPPTRKPSGVYRFLLPLEQGEKILHTIAFYPTTYRLQEEYPGKKDSVVITEGTWTPNEGFIWLYKDQIAQERYTWKGDTLQYYSPSEKKRFSMEKLAAASANKPWQTKRKEGALLYGVGTEPFWSIQLNKNDSLVLNMPDWSTPLQAKLEETTTGKDSTVYAAAAGDSLRLIVYPFFCSDGMSNFVYTKRIKLTYRGQTYHGCGEVFRR